MNYKFFTLLIIFNSSAMFDDSHQSTSNPEKLSTSSQKIKLKPEAEKQLLSIIKDVKKIKFSQQIKSLISREETKPHDYERNLLILSYKLNGNKQITLENAFEILDCYYINMMFIFMSIKDHMEKNINQSHIITNNLSITMMNKCLIPQTCIKKLLQKMQHEFHFSDLKQLDCIINLLERLYTIYTEIVEDNSKKFSKELCNKFKAIYRSQKFFLQIFSCALCSSNTISTKDHVRIKNLLKSITSLQFDMLEYNFKLTKFRLNQTFFVLDPEVVNNDNYIAWPFDTMKLIFDEFSIENPTF
ncbi:hypothetical protein M1446_00195 [Candidatus Dependentiae bacterium]|nr:hypothetical protein [Candidatus Dependentiae bacterium]